MRAMRAMGGAPWTLLGDSFGGGSESPESVKPDAFGRLQVSVSLVWGALDSMTPMAQGQTVKPLIPRSSLTVLPGVNHIPQIEDVAAFNAAIGPVLRTPP